MFIPMAQSIMGCSLGAHHARRGCLSVCLLVDHARLGLRLLDRLLGQLGHLDRESLCVRLSQDLSLEGALLGNADHLLRLLMLRA
jgi:hypothetical protein